MIGRNPEIYSQIRWLKYFLFSVGQIIWDLDLFQIDLATRGFGLNFDDNFRKGCFTTVTS